MDISDTDLIAKLTITEDPFTERKSNSDRLGWLKTVVAFANSTPIDQPAVLFVGVDNAGAICPANGRIEDLMKSFSDYIAKHVYPPVYTFPKELRHAGLSCLAVIVPGSANRPHFAGQSYIRDGTQTKEASEEKFVQMVASRQSKAYEIQKWIGKEFTRKSLDPTANHRRVLVASGKWVIEDCNSHFVTMTGYKTQFNAGEKEAVPLSWIDLSYDYGTNRLCLILKQTL